MAKNPWLRQRSAPTGWPAWWRSIRKTLSKFDPPAYVFQQNTYYLTILSKDGQGGVNLCGPLGLTIQISNDRVFNQDLPEPVECLIEPGVPFQMSFNPEATGTLNDLTLARVTDVGENSEEKTLRSR